jgi:lysophospholipase L1-like esterase
LTGSHVTVSDQLELAQHAHARVRRRDSTPVLRRPAEERQVSRPSIADRAAGRSGRSYASLLAARLGASLTDLPISGATTGTILDTPQRTLRRRTFPPQIDGLPDDADLFTVTAGGNNLGYIGGMIRAAWAGHLRARALTRFLASLVGRGGLPATTDEEVERATAGLARVVASVRARAPQARVVLVDYLPLVGAASVPGPDTPFSAEELAAFARIGTRLAEAFADAAARSGADLLHASALGADHGLGSHEPWVTGFRPSMRPAPFHPNGLGMEAVADALFRLVTG